MPYHFAHTIQVPRALCASVVVVIYTSSPYRVFQVAEYHPHTLRLQRTENLIAKHTHCAGVDVYFFIIKKVGSKHIYT